MSDPLEQFPPEGGFDERLAGVIDINSEPCSLLAEHVASASRGLMNLLRTRAHVDAYDPWFTTGALWDFDEPTLTTRVLVDRENGVPASQTFLSVKLGNGPNDVDRVATREFAAKLDFVEETRKKSLGRVAVKKSTLLENRIAYIHAVTRGNIAVPVYTVRTDRGAPDCSYVTILDPETGATDDVIATSRDAQSPEREIALAEIRRLVEDAKTRMSKPKIHPRLDYSQMSAKEEEPTVFYVNTRDLNIDQVMNKVLGNPGQESEAIIKTLLRGNRYTILNSSYARNVKVGNATYPARISIEGEANEDSTEAAFTTTVSLPEAPNIGEHNLFPPFRIHETSKDPLVFDGVEVGSEQHKSMVADLAQLVVPYYEPNKTA